ncbi:MAG: trigger factor [Clostridiales bacterium]|nr:trigger factor [Clostridiales bacterium]
MIVNVEELGDNKVKLEIQIDSERFDLAMQNAYLKNRGRISIDGFRKGKAPRQVIERFYGEGIFYEDAINEACPAAYDEAIIEKGLEPVSQPEIDIVEIGGDQGLIFTAEVTVKPEVELGQYKGIEIKRVEYNVTELDIDKDIERARENNARWITVSDRPVKEGDRLTLDYTGSIDGEKFEGGTAENQTLEIGSGSFIPGFEEQIVGMNIGDERDIQVTFPEEYHSENLKGKEATFTVKVHEIKEKELPELDDEFIKDISEFDTIDEYKTDIRQKMEEDSKKREKREMENQLLSKVAENAKINIPEVMVEAEIDSSVMEMDMNMRYQGMDLETYLQATNSSMEDFRAQFRDRAYNRIKLQLTLEKIAEEVGIEVTDQDLEDEYSRISKDFNIDIEQVKKEGMGHEESRKKNLKIQKAVDYLMEQAIILDSEDPVAEEPEQGTGDTEE